MRSFILACILALAAVAAPAEDLFLEEQAPLESFLWRKRPLVVFADTPGDPRYVLQLNMLREREAALVGRDVVVMTDTDPAAAGPLRQSLRPRGFTVVLLDKDGRVVLRKPSPRDVREIGHTIDRLPLRQEELRDGRAAAPGLTQ